MMKYVILIPHSLTSSLPLSSTSHHNNHFPRSRKTSAWPSESSSASEFPSAYFYPLHKSLEDEIMRLFSGTENMYLEGLLGKQQNDVMEEFRHNGKDTEYLPPEEDVKRPIISKKKKNKKPLPTECVFCKNNGETHDFYSRHILKDAEGKVVCPILREYKCPICFAKGDNSHTLKYCPQNPKPQSIPMANTLKGLRNATGKRRSK